MRVIVGISGASGAIYAIRLLQVLRAAGCEIHAVVSEQGWELLRYETGQDRSELSGQVDYLYDVRHMSAAIASGSFKIAAMVIVPCSMRTLGAIAGGLADNLITRAADVMLKEGRPLVIVPRETPLNAIHLENMLKLARLGVKVVPASPGFYHRPSDLQGLIDMLVGKICDVLGVEHSLFARWPGERREP